MYGYESSATLTTDRLYYKCSEALIKLDFVLLQPVADSTCLYIFGLRSCCHENVFSQDRPSYWGEMYLRGQEYTDPDKNKGSKFTPVSLSLPFHSLDRDFSSRQSKSLKLISLLIKL
jgi:hypothetical protein